MAKKKTSSKTKAPELAGRHFTDKALTEKAQRWAAQIRRAENFCPLKTDTIGNFDDAKDLAGHLFTPADAAVFLPALAQAVQ